MEKLIRNRHFVGQSAYHLVWRPKYNVSVFLHPWPRKIAQRAIAIAARKWKINIIELKVMSDHVHCFVEIPSTMSVSFALQILKGSSARAVFKKCTRWKKFFKEGHKVAHLWSPGKFFRSVGCVSQEVVEAYIKYSQDDWNVNFDDKAQQKLGI